jgi:hypothetical protein
MIKKKNKKYFQSTFGLDWRGFQRPPLSEHPINTGHLEGNLNLDLEYHFSLHLPCQRGQRFTRQAVNIFEVLKIRCLEKK